MKRYFSLLVVLVCTLFIGISSAKAAAGLPSSITCTAETEGHCILTVNKDNENINELHVTLRIGEGRSFSGLSINTSDWILISKTEPTSVNTADPYKGYYVNEYILKLKAPKMTKDTYTVLEFDTSIFNYGIVCNLNYTLFGECITRYACSVNDGIYYDKTGSIVSENEYKASCSCYSYNGKYFDKNGSETTLGEYAKQCDIKCSALPDGRYIGSEKTVVDAATYEAQCSKKCYNDADNGTLYDKDGNVTTDIVKWIEQCSLLTCAQWDIENKTTGEKTTYYLDKNGKSVEKTQYEDECLEKPKCQMDNGKYYNKDGQEVNEIEYYKSCSNLLCKKLSDGTYYGDNGTIVSELDYQKQCVINICAKIGDTFFGKDGQEVSEADYKASCEVPKCVQKDGKYYDNNGKEVSKKVFENKCPDAVQTGDNTNLKMYLYVGLGLILTIGIMYFSKKYSKINQI